MGLEAPTAESRTVVSGGVSIHYLDSGDDGSGRAPIVFSPGLTDVADDYHQVIPELGRRTVVVDYRGRGKSAAPDAGYAMADHVGDLDAVVREVTDGPVHLMTFSRGSCYAVGYTLAHPDRVLSIAIGDYPVREIAFPDGAEFIDRFLDQTWRGTPVRDRLSETAFRGILREAVGRTFWDQLAALALPLLAVRAGAGGSPLDDTDWDRYETLFPGATLVTFDESPHDIFRPDRFRYPRLVHAHVEAAEAR